MSVKDIYQAMFEFAPDGVIISNAKGEILMVNNYAKKLFGYRSEEMVGLTVESLIPKQYIKNHRLHREGYYNKPALRQMGARNELKAKRKDGSQFFVEISLSPIEVDNEHQVIANVRNVDEKVEMKRELQRTISIIEKKNNELEQFAYMVSHDLQEPLRTVTHLSELITKDYKELLDEEGKKCLHFITDATKRMNKLILGLLEYSRIGKSGNINEIDCNTLLSTIESDLTKSIEDSGAKVKIGQMPVVKGYETELRALFQNLISNAIKFRKPEVSPEIEVNCTSKGEYWQFSVKDNGIGIEEKNKERIFVIFQRLHDRKKYEGTGIGLTHCQKILELHGGEIWVEPEIGKGSTFYFTLPA